MSNFVSTLLVAGALIGGGLFAYVSKHPEAVDEWMAMRPQWAQSAKPYTRTKAYDQCRRDFGPTLRKKSLNDQRAACECFDKEFSQWPAEMQKAASVGRTFAMMPNLVQASKPKADIKKLSKNDIQNMVMNEKRKRQEMATRLNEGMSANPASMLAVGMKVQALLRACKVM